MPINMTGSVAKSHPSNEEDFSFWLPVQRPARDYTARLEISSTR
jgi:hypothetical protein